jgi:hypothetical protein
MQPRMVKALVKKQSALILTFVQTTKVTERTKKPFSVLLILRVLRDKLRCFSLALLPGGVGPKKSR